jgi:hypothetical protein
MMVVDGTVAVIMNQNLTWCCTQYGPADALL